ncbi:hypothetical protein QRO08_06350 [Paracidovorax citrulli]|uniref:Uncharacterized protein n=1 Tax=Paracidovorax citrulli TaxID=80869 RepID=A0ABY9ATN0_PARCI|nr:hypothetical protein [Paracidovorax citrulli]UMT82381.1 hypothetical protein FRC75_02625 [Paracidovorax citrulli]WIY30633.1 hypothetical protein QRO09_02580 [Paracidovorax citrulli]WIY42922.1 hypothetical protein QRO12_18520 [Paracidovorax citrulli]WIY50188.1 hypothetical protein QRO08_06350 [Paracidovorax citrulli]
MSASPQHSDEDKNQHEDLQHNAELLGARPMEILLTRWAIFELCAYVIGFITFWIAAYYVTRAAVRDGMRDAMPRRPIDRPAWADTHDMRADR